MKNILITGGTAGLGRALATQLAAQGFNVAVVARHAKPMKGITVIEGDVSDKNQVHRIFSETLAAIGDPDTLINNASSLGPASLKLLVDTDCEDFANAFETNVLAPFRLTKLVMPAMLLRGEGTIVNISSDAAVQDYAMWGAYSVTKSALDHLTRIFAAESGLRFLAIDPGDMATALHRQALPDADFMKLHDPADSAARLIELLKSSVHGAQHRGLR